MSLTLTGLVAFFAKGISYLGHASGVIGFFKDVVGLAKNPAEAIGIPSTPRGTEEELKFGNLYMTLTPKKKSGVDAWLDLVYTAPQGAGFLTLPAYSSAKQDFFKFVINTENPKGYLEKIADEMNKATTLAEKKVVISRYRGLRVPMPEVTSTASTIESLYVHVGPKDGFFTRIFDRIL